MEYLQSIGKVMLILFIISSCVEPYDPPVDDRDVHYLAVDGFISASDGAATVTLTRTLPVKSEGTIPAESGAFVSIEDDQGFINPLTETGTGIYKGLVANVNFDTRYHLVIRTDDNEEYASDFIALQKTPPIDSINYSMGRDGLVFNVNTHDITGKTNHYRWKYRETYEYNSIFNSVFMFEDGEPVYRPDDLSIYTCWRTLSSTNIIISSTERLTGSVVSNQPVTVIPPRSIKLSRKYSLLVQQQALSKEAYNYWLNLQNSTERLGGLFDPLPSEVIGNIHCTTNPAKIVIGFFSGGSLQEARIFLDRDDVPLEMGFYNYFNTNCQLDTLSLEDVAGLPRSSLLVDAVYAPGVGIVGYTTSVFNCIDCTSMGGTTIRPDFWE